MGSPTIYSRLAADELPYVFIEASELFLYAKERFGIIDGGSDFQPVANDAGILEQGKNLAPVITSDAVGIEMIESAAVVVALVEDRAPAQSGLCPFEDEEFEQRPVIMNGDAPFFVVIRDRKSGARPSATNGILFEAGLDGIWLEARPPRLCLPAEGIGTIKTTAKILDRTCSPAFYGRAM